MTALTYAWQPPASGVPDTYNLYEGAASGQETLLASVPGTQTAYSHNRAPGPYAAYVTAVTGGAEGAKSGEATGTVAAPDFSLAPGTFTPDPNGSGGILPIIVTPLNGFHGTVSLTLDSLPAGVSDYHLINNGLRLLAPPGSYAAVVRGTAGSLTHTFTTTITTTPARDQHTGKVTL